MCSPSAPSSCHLSASRTGLSVPDGLLLRPPLDEGHHRALQQVDRSPELHASYLFTALMKFWRIVRPTAPDFSGWNWVP